MGTSGSMDSLLDPANSREIVKCDRRNGLLMQAERDPYIYESRELGFAVKKPRRRGVA
jgi:hypothetical protein